MAPKEWWLDYSAYRETQHPFNPFDDPCNVKLCCKIKILERVELQPFDEMCKALLYVQNKQYTGLHTV